MNIANNNENFAFESADENNSRPEDAVIIPALSSAWNKANHCEDFEHVNDNQIFAPHERILIKLGPDSPLISGEVLRSKWSNNNNGYEIEARVIPDGKQDLHMRAITVRAGQAIKTTSELMGLKSPTP